MFVPTEKRVMTTASRWELTPQDDTYPETLQDFDTPPKRLYGIGSPEVLSSRCLAVIGARRATPYGLTVAEMAGRIAAECGITVVSGGAMGCDAAALRAAQLAGGTTIVIPGTGADYVYPATSRDVFDHAPNNGCILSLEDWGTPPRPYNFPKRNHIIAALSEVLLVAEAGERSGTSSTATCAAELGRTIYAVPGSIFSPESMGANRLIVEGALPIVSEEDLEMRISMDYGVIRLMSGGVRKDMGRIMSALVAMPMRPDDLANRLGETPLNMLMALSDLEANGSVDRLPDGRYAASRDFYVTG